jgi:hydroxyacylglutathione hydrolase
MIVETIWTNNQARNFNYLVGCPETGQCVAIDPVAYELCLDRAAQRGWKITHIVNTHEHADHISGNRPMVAATGAKLLAPHNALGKIDSVDQPLAEGDVVRTGCQVELLVLETPGHTQSHICLLTTEDPPRLFSGDAVFNAGVGNCRRGGDPTTLYETLASKVFPLPPATRLYPGHEYIRNNLAFSLDREPDNREVQQLLEQLGESYDPNHPVITTLDVERLINPFFRLQCQAVIERLRESFPDLPEEPLPLEVFRRLRQLRDGW